jgi:hypothetical protein
LKTLSVAFRHLPDPYSPLKPLSVASGTCPTLLGARALRNGQITSGAPDPHPDAPLNPAFHLEQAAKALRPLFAQGNNGSAPPGEVPLCMESSTLG